MQDFIEAYADCALWISVDDTGEPLDSVYWIDDIAPDAQEQMTRDCNDFVSRYGGLISDAGLSMGQAGHDFWLTRNGHGAGFWDRGLGAIGDALTEAAKEYGETYLYVGDDGMIYTL
jgi:hypothetical protein